MAIPLGRSSPSASCDRPERRHGGSPGASDRSETLPLLLGLAPGGVFPAAAVAGGAVRSYRTVSPLPAVRYIGGPAVCFLWHFPWGRPRRVLPGTVPTWSPDFPLSAKCGERPSDRLARWNLGIRGALVKTRTGHVIQSAKGEVERVDERRRQHPCQPTGIQSAAHPRYGDNRSAEQDDRDAHRRTRGIGRLKTTRSTTSVSAG